MSLSSPSQGDTPRVPRSCRGQAGLKLRPSSLHKRHQQQSPAQEPPQGTAWGQRGHCCSSAKPSLAWHPKKEPRETALTHKTPRRCCSPAESARDQAGGMWPSTESPASTWRWQRAGARGESGLQQQMASEVDLRQFHLPTAMCRKPGFS